MKLHKSATIVKVSASLLIGLCVAIGLPGYACDLVQAIVLGVCVTYTMNHFFEHMILFFYEKQ